MWEQLYNMNQIEEKQIIEKTIRVSSSRVSSYRSVGIVSEGN